MISKIPTCAARFVVVTDCFNVKEFFGGAFEMVVAYKEIHSKPLPAIESRSKLACRTVNYARSRWSWRVYIREGALLRQSLPFLDGNGDGWEE